MTMAGHNKNIYNEQVGIVQQLWISWDILTPLGSIVCLYDPCTLEPLLCNGCALVVESRETEKLQAYAGTYGTF